MSSDRSLPSIQVRHNTSINRFEVEIEGRLAVAEYRRENDRIIFTHTYVPPELRTRGIAARLAEAGLTFAREAGLQVFSACSYVDHYIKQHPEYGNLLKAG